MAEKILVLCSGGFDSIVMLNELVQIEAIPVEDIHIMFFNYGQKNYVQECACTEIMIDKLNIPRLNTIGFQLPNFSGWASSSLTDDNVENPHSLGSQYVPMRNMIFFSYALSYAQSKGCKKIYSAILSNGTYDDTNSGFLESMTEIAERVGIKFVFPYATETKMSLAGLARKMGIKPDDFFSCNTPVNGEPCGVCWDCKQIARINKEYLTDSYPLTVAMRNDFVPTPDYREKYMDYELQEVRMLINNKCNMKCTHCFYGFDEMTGFEMSLEKWHDLIKESASLNPSMHFHFSGKEPFYDELIFELADYIDSLNDIRIGNNNLTYDVVTNGVNVPKYIDKIVERHFKRICVSVDYKGCTRNFGGVEEVIDLLVRVGIPVHAFIVVHNDNIQHIPDMIRQLDDMGVEEVCIKDVMDLGSGSDFELVSTLDYVKLYSQLKTLLSEVSLSITFMVKGRHFWDIWGRLRSRGIACQLTDDLLTWSETSDPYFGEDGKMCLAPEYACTRYLNQITVTPDGYILGCATEVASPAYARLSAGVYKKGQLKDTIEFGRLKALRAIEHSECKSCIQCYHKNLLSPLTTGADSGNI